MELAEQRYQHWCAQKTLDPELRQELAAMQNDADKITDAFYRDLEFGTAGLRGVLGAGTNRMNIYVIRRATQAVADYLNETDLPKTVAIGHDSRIKSDVFAREAAAVFAANGITAYLYPRLEPVPALSFAVRHLHCGLGICVTASHNPATYNGIKLIVHEGRDASLEETGRVEEIIASLKEEDVKTMNLDEAFAKGLAEIVKNPFNHFIDDIIAQMDMQKIRDRGPRVLFDPMHGSGTYPLLVILCTARCTIDLMHSNKDAYFGGLMPAPSQVSLGELTSRVVREGYDLGIALDGDGDRLGIVDSNGNYISANDILCMLYYYLHEYKGWKGPVVRNLATTHMLDRIAESFGETCYEVPVGFKYISSKLDEVDAVLGGESSGGLTVRGHIFGKDSIYAASLFVA